MLSETQKSFFEKNGYLIIDNFFSIDELNDFKEAFRLIIQTKLSHASETHNLNPADFLGKEFDDGLMELEKINHDYVAEIYDSLAQLPELLRLSVKKETTEVINQLIDRPIKNPLYTYTCRCRIDPPSDNRRTYGWHQEIFYSVPKSTFLQTWAPLIRNATKDMGTISICSESHKEGIPEQSWNEPEGRAIQIIVDDKIVQKYSKQFQIEMNLGQILVFSPKLFHKSNNNISNKIRYSLIGMYHDLSNTNFKSPTLKFAYRGISPKEYYENYFSKSTRDNS